MAHLCRYCKTAFLRTYKEGCHEKETAEKDEVESTTMAEGFLDVLPDAAMEERDEDEGEREEKETMDSEKDTTPDP